LTPREREVLSILAQGRADTEIARQLGVTPFTANRHVANILRKLGANSRTEAAVRAMKYGLLQ
jgi:DNA-binding NarL/FixJ family response regulator